MKDHLERVQPYVPEALYENDVVASMLMWKCYFIVLDSLKTIGEVHELLSTRGPLVIPNARETIKVAIVEVYQAIESIIYHIYIDIFLS